MLHRVFLFVGLAAGVLLTAYGLLARAGDATPGAAVAIVNGDVIGRDLYERVVAGVEADRGALSPQEKRHVLERMIEEELLVQQAVALGMASRDRMARGYLVQAMMDFVGQQSPAEADEDALRAFYEANPDKFRRPGRIALETMGFDVVAGVADEAALARAEQARGELQAGAAWETVARKYADEPIVQVPRAPLSASNVLEYLGPTATRAAFKQKPGAVGEPVRTKTGYLVIRVTQRWDDVVPPFDEVRDEAAAEWKAAHAAETLRAYLDDLRRAAVVEIQDAP